MVAINGEPKDAAGQSVLEYMEKNGYNAKAVVVELNLEIIPRDELGNVILKDEDTLEILRFVGGG